MYEYLEGTVSERTAASLVLDVGGIGYELLVPLGAALPSTGERARLWTHLAVREDAHTLYGFVARPDRELFRQLLRVRGVGPTMALAVLSGLTGAELVRAILDGDAKALTRVKGVGKKTAEQMLLDLRDRAELLDAAGAPDVLVPQAPPSRAEGNIADAVAALASIGYSDKEARKQVERAAEAVDPNDLEALVRAAVQG